MFARVFALSSKHPNNAELFHDKKLSPVGRRVIREKTAAAVTADAYLDVGNSPPI